MIPEQACGNCRFFTRERFECHRHAPAGYPHPVNPSINGFKPFWPSVRPEMWCGDWQVAVAPEPR